MTQTVGSDGLSSLILLELGTNPTLTQLDGQLVAGAHTAAPINDAALLRVLVERVDVVADITLTVGTPSAGWVEDELDPLD